MYDLPLRSRQLLSSSDVCEVQSHLCRILRPHDIHVQKTHKRFNFTHNQARLGSLSLNAIAYGAGVSVKGPEAEEAFLVKFTLRGQAEVHNGRSVLVTRPGSIYIFNPTQPVHCNLSEDHYQLILRIPKTNIEQHLRNELACSLSEPLQFKVAGYDVDRDAPGLYSYVNEICNNLMQVDSCYEAPRIARHAGQLLNTLLLTYLPHNFSDAYRRASAPPAPHYVRRVEDYIRTHFRDDITLDDMVSVAGISVRSLQTGFRKYRDLSPMEHLRNWRLERAREELQKAWRDGRTVTEIALECGFTHLSKFSRYYHQRFGEMPSQTLLSGHTPVR